MRISFKYEIRDYRQIKLNYEEIKVTKNILKNVVLMRAYNPEGKNVPENNQNFGRRVSAKYKAKGTFFINDGYKAVGRNLETGRFERLV